MSNKFPTEEIVNIPVKRYRDKDGERTCAISFQAGSVCIYHGGMWFANGSLCEFTGDYLSRRGGDCYGTLIPCDKCPLWKE